MKQIFTSITLSLFLVVTNLNAQTAGHFKCSDGEIVFVSDAPMELISAKSNNLQAVINPAQHTFAFVVSIRTFEGFNAALQRDHFNENYMESGRYPNATFTGKILETYDFSTPGIYSVRAQGMLKIHGVEQERNIKAIIKVTAEGLEVYSKFTVALKDHRIAIPKVVYDKISSEVNVIVSGKLRQGEK